MGYFITNKGEYYEGDRAFKRDIEVTKRPSVYHVWINGAWTENDDLRKDYYKQMLAATDGGMARVAEDLYDSIIKKGLMVPADFPNSVVNKIAERKTIRALIK